MIIYRALYRETARIWFAIVFVLLALFSLILFGHLLSRAARGEFAQTLVLALLGLQLLRYLDVLIPMAFYFGLLLVLGRWYRDSEMAVLAACGIGLPQLLRPVLVLATVCVALTAVLSLYLNPWANRLSERLKLQGKQRSEITLVQPGVFTESPASGRIIYSEAIGDDGVMHNVFIANPREADLGIIVARTGRSAASPDGGDPQLILHDGSVYDGDPGRSEFRLADFDMLKLRIDSTRSVGEPSEVNGLPTSQIRRRGDRHALAEWHWRLARPVGAMVMAMIALGLAYTDPRRGRAGGIVAAILVYFIYSNLLGFGVALLRNGRISDAIGLWWVHLLAGAFAAYLLWRRFGNLPLLPWLSRAR